LDKFELGKATASGSAGQALRILLVVNLPWDARLGAVRVFMELEQAWRALGHAVEKFSLNEAYPRASASPAVSALRQALFGYKAAAFVRRNVGRYDVIDALIGSLHGSKAKLGFRGLLVARSVGLYRLYERFERTAHERWPQAGGRLAGRIFYTLMGRWHRRVSDAAINHADLVNLPNEEESACLHAELDPALPITVQPYGLTVERREALRNAAAPAEMRLARQKVSFVGMWAPRKGSCDWSNIVRQVWRKLPDVCFCFFGTMVEPEKILLALGVESSDRIEVVAEYSQADLPALLAPCAVGALPSYVEGFGIAVIEQLAAGLPTVAFDVAGPRDILGRGLNELLVPAGDADKFAAALVNILERDISEYRALSSRSIDRAGRFTWSDIAKNTAAIYRDHLAGQQPGPA